jgi:hypothetical protein
MQIRSRKEYGIMKASLAAGKAAKVINDKMIELGGTFETQNLYPLQNDVAENLLSSNENPTYRNCCSVTTLEDLFFFIILQFLSCY